MALFCYERGIALSPLFLSCGPHARHPHRVHAYRDRALPALRGHRYPIRPRLADLPVDGEAEESRTAPGQRTTGHGPSRRPSRRQRLRLCDHSGHERQKSAGDLLLLAYGHFAGLHGQERAAPGHQELSRRRHRAAGRSDAGDSRRRASRSRRPDRQRHHHDRRHHPARRRQQGRRRRDHGCGAVPDPEPADQARHHQDPVHPRRGDRPRRRQGRPQEAWRRFRLYDGRRDRRTYRGRDLFRRRRHHCDSGRQHPSGFCQGQDGARDQDRGRHRRAPAQGYLLAGNDRRQGRLPASDRDFRRAGRGDAEPHRPRFHRSTASRTRRRCWRPSSAG